MSSHPLSKLAEKPFGASEEQGDQAYPLTVTVTDDGEPALSAAQSFTLYVASTETPQPPSPYVPGPVVLPLDDLRVAENIWEIAVFAQAYDADTYFDPAQADLFTFTVEGLPAGATWQEWPDGTVSILWQPTPEQAVGSYNVTIHVTEHGAGDEGLTDAETFTITFVQGSYVQPYTSVTHETGPLFATNPLVSTWNGYLTTIDLLPPNFSGEAPMLALLDYPEGMYAAGDTPLGPVYGDMPGRYYWVPGHDQVGIHDIRFQADYGNGIVEERSVKVVVQQSFWSALDEAKLGYLAELTEAEVAAIDQHLVDAETNGDPVLYAAAEPDVAAYVIELNGLLALPDLSAESQAAVWVAQQGALGLALVAAAAPAQPVTVQGTIKYDTAAGQAKPVRGARVRVTTPGFLGFPRELGITFTDDFGQYSLPLPVPTSPYTNLTIHVSTQSQPAGSLPSQVTRAVDVFFKTARHVSDPWAVRFYPNTLLPTYQGIVRADTTIGSTTERGRAFWVFDAAITASRFHASLNNTSSGLVSPGLIPIVFPASSLGTSFTIGQKCRIIDSDFDNWDTIIHEYGHAVQQTMKFFPFEPGDYLSGAPMSHYAEVNQRSEHWLTSNLNVMKLAFSEGFANFFSMAAQNDMGVWAYTNRLAPAGDYLYNGWTLETGLPVQANIIDSRTINNNPNFPLVNTPTGITPVGNSSGYDEELTVMRILWDLYDIYSISDNVQGRQLAPNGFSACFSKGWDDTLSQPHPQKSPANQAVWSIA